MDARVRRWQQELTNMRQHVYFSESVLADVQTCRRDIDAAAEVFFRELKSIKAVVGSRNSVPKEVVYPKFDLLARNWMQAAEELSKLRQMQACWNMLQETRGTFRRTMTQADVVAARRGLSRTVVDAKSSTAADEGDAGGEGKLRSDNSMSQQSGTESREEAASMVSARAQMVVDMVQDRGEFGVNATVAAGGGGVNDMATTKRLAYDTTPEIMNLPLELAGYCPWTIVARKGLLLPGDVEANGLVQYRTHFFAFTSLRAAEAFSKSPQRYINGVHAVAKANPELINLLGLSDVFPEVSVSALVSGLGKQRSGEQVHPLLAAAPSKKVDASTGTPTHFIDSSVDLDYCWNEWDMRRKALQMCNIRKAKTTSSQTDESHFREDAETQVYLPRNTSTQTATERGTNPRQSHNYIVGLRGFEGKRRSGTIDSKYANSEGPRNRSNTMAAAGANVLNLSFEV